MFKQKSKKFWLQWTDFTIGPKEASLKKPVNPNASKLSINSFRLY